ncbi:hypothetical protein [Streptosporangium sp. NPDC006007]|uniref:hypothetical protein n=1 Tax=Streptosporangium sp. NPDC006007 TaxID=3154575 RepID=UPI0033BE5FF7
MTRVVLHIDRVVLESGARQEFLDALTEAVHHAMAGSPAGRPSRRRLSVDAADGSMPGLARAVVSGIREAAGGGGR